MKRSSAIFFILLFSYPFLFAKESPNFNYDAKIASLEAQRAKKETTQGDIALADVLFFKGLVTRKDKREDLLKEARNILVDADALSPDNADIYAALARIDGQLALYRPGKEKIKMAQIIKDNAERALQLNPNQPVANLVLGTWYYELANLSGIERFFAKIFYGQTQEIPKGDFNQSLIYLEKASRLRPDVIYGHLVLAKTLIKLKKVEEARAQLQIAISLNEEEAIDAQFKKEAEALIRLYNKPKSS